jgi:rare lipoprotein A (peptidoglycan hydrolase)
MKKCMPFGHMRRSLLLCVLLLLGAVSGWAETPADNDAFLNELSDGFPSPLEELVAKDNPQYAREGFASYYAQRFVGRKTTSGQRYHPRRMTAAHATLPLGTVVRVVNPATSQAVQVTVNDRCAKKSVPFIDLSQAAAEKIGLYGKGKIRVVIIPLSEGEPDEPA